MEASHAPLRCYACGAEVPRAGACHGSCPSARGCALIQCPSCGTEIPDPTRSKLASLLAAVIGRGRRQEQSEEEPR